MSDANHDIQLALRTAAGHERAAVAAEQAGAKAYEMKMISAGAAAYSAFALAIKAAPEYKGRKIDDAAVKRIYKSNAPRPWWDKHLGAVKVDGKPGNREWAKRVILWHIDPNAARARHAGHLLRASNQRKLQAKSGGQGAPAPRQPTTAEARSTYKAMQGATPAPQIGARTPQDAPSKPAEAWTVNDLLGEVNRIGSAVRKVAEADRSAVLEILRVTAREIEGYCS